MERNRRRTGKTRHVSTPDEMKRDTWTFQPDPFVRDEIIRRVEERAARTGENKNRIRSAVINEQLKAALALGAYNLWEDEQAKAVERAKARLHGADISSTASHESEPAVEIAKQVVGKHDAAADRPASGRRRR